MSTKLLEKLLIHNLQSKQYTKKSMCKYRRRTCNYRKEALMNCKINHCRSHMLGNFRLRPCNLTHKFDRPLLMRIGRSWTGIEHMLLKEHCKTDLHCTVLWCRRIEMWLHCKQCSVHMADMFDCLIDSLGHIVSKLLHLSTGNSLRCKYYKIW